MKVERILVAVDSSPHSMAALETAADLAGSLEAALIGIFVEDADLLRLAELPFAREMLYPSALGRPIETSLMRERLRDLAEQARDALSQYALQAEVNWTFRVRRGPVLSEIVAAAREADLLVIGKASHVERRSRVRLGAMAAHLISRSPRPLLILQYGKLCQGPALIVCDGTDQSIQKLPQARAWAETFGETATVLLLAETREQAEVLKKRIAKTTGQTDLNFRRCTPHEHGALARISHEEESGLIILTGTPLDLPPEELPEFLEEIDCPVLVCR